MAPKNLLILILIICSGPAMLSAQKVGIGTQNTQDLLHISNGNFRIEGPLGRLRFFNGIDIGSMEINGLNFWISNHTTGKLYLRTNNFVRMAIDDTGNIGIGTINPNAKLEVVGTLKVVDGTHGAGKILTSDATGLASWQSPPPPPPPYYPSVSICCQSWMTKNLDVSTYRNGDPIPKVTSNTTWAALTTGAYCYYNNDSTTYAATYGKLYNWYAVNDPRGLAPEGWHIPSDFEWTTLGSCLGGDGVAGGPMKEIGTSHWTTPNTGATNLSNFTGLPGGWRDNTGSFSQIGHSGVLWSSTEFNTNMNNALSRTLFNTSDDLSKYDDHKRRGFSVRCLKD